MSRGRHPRFALLPAVPALLAAAGCSVLAPPRASVDAWAGRAQDATVATRMSESVVGVVTRDGSSVRFDRPGRLGGECVDGRVDGLPVAVPVPSVQRWLVESRRGETVKELGLAASLSITGFDGAAKATQGCPFVYSWDGTRFRFDAEPWAGAVTRGLERHDDSVLEFLRPVDGRYHLLLTNEVLQAQHVDHVSLRVVDHAPGVQVVAETGGKLRGIRSPFRLASARTAAGEDLTPWLAASDDLTWEPPPSVGPGGDGRDEIVLTFPKITCSERALLVVGGGTSLFGSRMIREALDLRGRDLENWYASMDASPDAVSAWRYWGLREELWSLKIDVEEPTGWETRGVLPGAGPLVSKERAVLLELKKVVGDTLRIRISPPRGYWAFNSFAIVYGEEPIEVQEVSLAEARDSSGRDRLPALVAPDRGYDEMPVGGSAVHLAFDAPPQGPGTERTVVLHSRGWYRLDLSPAAEPDLAALRRLEEEPGYGVRLAAERWERWQAERRAEARAR